ncbi:IS3 family transposase [Dactylosporangium sp. NPDC000555]|uniref:IS3 family transposase n=1 Tax=Dactylosporangium sp. NPDC000555 TaxID=3154260 RepID=UPI00331C2BE9
MAAPRKYPDELRERAVRLVFEMRKSTGQKQGAIARVADQLGVHREALRGWVRQAEVDSAARPGTSSEDGQRIAELEREVRELRRANDILKAAAKFLRAVARPATDQIVAFLDIYGALYGVEPICQVLRDAGLPIAPSTYYAARNRPPSTRSVRDDELCRLIQAAYDANYRVYGARKIWRQLLRDGEQVARCTVERLMRRLGIRGARRGRTPRTTRSDPALPKPADLLRRNFTATAPNTRWVADYTYVPIEGQTVYVAFVIDLYSRAIVGWRLAEHQRTDLPLDALTMALWQRRPDRDALIHHSDHGSQYLSIRYTHEVELAGAQLSAGTVGDSYDNALAETVIGLYKTELVARQGPWHTPDQLEIATLEWVDWYNHRRLHEACDYRPPAEYEALYYLNYPPVTVDTAH